MILAAGRGERMRPLTDTVPKPLLLAGGKPLIGWHLERLARIGIREVVINHAWLGDRIETALGDGRRYGLAIRYSAEGTALETAGGIARALPLLVDDEADDRPFLTLSADVYSDFDLGRASTIALQMDASRARCWCVMAANPSHHGRGDFILEGGRLGLVAAAPAVSAVSAAPTASADNGGAAPRALTYTGIGLFRPSLFRRIVAGTRLALRPVLDQAIARGEAAGERYDGQWFDIGTPERLMALDRRLLGAGDGAPQDDQES